MWIRGVGVLTTERFTRIVQGSPILYNYFGILGALINNTLPKKVDIDIPLAAIAVIGRGKLGLLKDVLYIETVEGKSYQLTPKYDYWFNGLKGVLGEQGATLVQSGDDRWTVQR
jgi:hypothetical protein